MTPAQQARFEERFGEEPLSGLAFKDWKRQRQGYTAACEDEAKAREVLVKALQEISAAGDKPVTQGDLYCGNIAKKALAEHEGSGTMRIVGCFVVPSPPG